MADALLTLHGTETMALRLVCTDYSDLRKHSAETLVMVANCGGGGGGGGESF